MEKKTKFKNEEKLNLKEELKDLYKEKFKLLIEKSNGTQFKKRHKLKEIRIKIARILTFITKIKREKNEI